METRETGHHLRHPHHIAITGASSGIGAALAAYYAGPGTRLSLQGRDSTRLNDVSRKCRVAGSEVFCQLGDVRSRSVLHEWLCAADDAAPVDLVVANAGIGGRAAITEGGAETAEQAAAIIQTNLIGAINTVTPLLPRFVERRHGQVVLVGSLAGFLALPDAPAYCASKAALRVYGHALRRLLAPHNVKVTVVCPGFVETPMSASLLGRRPFLWSSEQAARRIARDILRGRKESCFPLPLVLATRLGAALPLSLMDRVFAYRRQRAGT